jgi:hypothetical protein
LRRRIIHRKKRWDKFSIKAFFLVCSRLFYQVNRRSTLRVHIKKDQPILLQEQLWNCPKSKWPTRFSRIDHSPATARYGSRNHLAAIPCPSCLPCLAIFQTRPWKTTDKEAKSKCNIPQNSCPVKGVNGKYTLKSQSLINLMKNLMHLPRARLISGMGKLQIWSG